MHHWAIDTWEVSDSEQDARDDAMAEWEALTPEQQEALINALPAADELEF